MAPPVWTGKFSDPNMARFFQDVMDRLAKLERESKQFLKNNPKDITASTGDRIVLRERKTLESTDRSTKIEVEPSPGKKEIRSTVSRDRVVTVNQSGLHIHDIPANQSCVDSEISPTALEVVRDDLGGILRTRLRNYGAKITPVFQRANGTCLSPTKLNDNDYISFQEFDGYDGSAFSNAAAISVRVDGPVSAGKVPSAIEFNTRDINGNFNSSILTIGSSGSAGVGNIANVDSSSIFECRSTTKGFLAPRMTSTQRDAISSPSDGLVIYNTSTGSFNFYDSVRAVWLGITMLQEARVAAETVNSTPLVLTSMTQTLQSNSIRLFRVHATAKDTSNTIVNSYVRTCQVHRFAGGAIIDQINDDFIQESDVALDCTFTASGNDIRIEVTGKAATTINWTVRSVDLVT